MRVREQFTLKGNYSFDALSPDASKLYLIQRVDANNYSRYIVRAYDLSTHTLLPGRIADRTQKSWVMQGDAMTRTTSPDGRWVYTLYMNPGGTPFIHALDTVQGRRALHRHPMDLGGPGRPLQRRADAARQAARGALAERPAAG